MKYKYRNILLQFCFGLLLAFSLNSCLTYKQIVNFQDGEDLSDAKIDSIINYTELKIQPDDVLQINISSYNQVEAAKFNTLDLRSQAQIGQANSGSSSVTEPIGYRVDKYGELDLPVIGKLKVSGLTIEQLKELVDKKVTETGYLLSHEVQIRYLSFKVTILGEVNAPGTFIIPNTKITILEAIGLSKDLTVFSNRDNILVIREEDGKRVYGRLNLKSKAIFDSPYFYLHPNDIVYVEPHQSKVLSVPDPATRYVSTIIGLATVITLIITLFK